MNKLKVGEIRPTHVALIIALLGTLWFVFPRSTRTRTARETVGPTDSKETSAHAARNPPPPAAAIAESGRVIPVRPDGEKMTAVSDASSGANRLSPVRLAPFEEAKLQLFAMQNPFVSAHPASESTDATASDRQQDEAAAESGIVAPEDQLTVQLESLASQLRTSRIGLLYTSSNGSRAAIVDGKTLRPGDSLRAGVQIQEIAPDNLALRIDRQSLIAPADDTTGQTTTLDLTAVHPTPPVPAAANQLRMQLPPEPCDLPMGVATRADSRMDSLRDRGSSRTPTIRATSASFIRGS
ncbi:MAG: general secretion pathway protein GspB, partial [Planctomycetaceae bacterium]|nr:general secretion pathway protein GspB [Planctomycetaceae bacterium]